MGGTRLALLTCLLASNARANLEGNKWVFHHGARDEAFDWNGSSRGTPMLFVDDLADRFQLKRQYDPETFLVTLANPTSGSTVRFHTYAKRVEGRLKRPGSVAGFTMELSKAPRFEGVRLTVPLDFGDRALRPLLTGLVPANPLLRQPRKVDVILDPGHGGNDYGTSFREKDFTIHEKDAVLALARELSQRLESRGLRVGFTREDDAFLSLPERTHLANAMAARLFVSLHMNFDPGLKARGFEVYVLSLTQTDEDARAAVAAENQMIPEDLNEGIDRAVAELRAEANFESSLTWAKTLQKSLHGAALPSPAKAVRTGPFYVLYGAEMPALLLEWGYLQNADDRALFLSSAKRAAALDALADSIATRLGHPKSASTK